MVWSNVLKSADRSRRMSSDCYPVSAVICMSFFVTLSKAGSVLWSGQKLTGISQTGFCHSVGHEAERQ